MRYKLNDLLTQITTRVNAAFPDNTTGAITASSVRVFLTDMLTDFVHSFRGALAYMYRGGAPLPVSLTSAFTSVPALMDVAVVVDPTENNAAVATQSIQAGVTADFEWNFEVVLEGPSNDEVLAAIAVDGVPFPFFQSRVQLAGPGKPVILDGFGYVRLNAAQKITLVMRSEGASSNVTFSSATLISRLIPSRT